MRRRTTALVFAGALLASAALMALLWSLGVPTFALFVPFVFGFGGWGRRLGRAHASRCPGCGAPRHPDHAFCPRCGIALPT